MPEIVVRAVEPEERPWIASVCRCFWMTEQVVAHGEGFTPADLPGLIAWMEGEPQGLLCHTVSSRSCQIIAMASLRQGLGIGSALIDALLAFARESGCRRVWLVTTNDNLEALAFYQKRGFELVAVHRNALERSRVLKPEIPRIGNHGIPLRDEIELEIGCGEM